MANVIQRFIEIIVKSADAVKGLKDTKQGLEGVDEAYKQVSKSQELLKDGTVKTTSSFEKAKKSADGVKHATEGLTDSVIKNGGAMGVLGEITGGVSNTFKDVYEAIGLTNTGLTGLKGAIAATGIGILIIGLISLVSNWDSWTSAIDGSTAALERNKTALEATQAVFGEFESDLDFQIQKLQAAGATESAILETRLRNRQRYREDVEHQRDLLLEAYKIEGDFSIEAQKKFNDEDQKLKDKAINFDRQIELSRIKIRREAIDTITKLNDDALKKEPKKTGETPEEKAARLAFEASLKRAADDTIARNKLVDDAISAALDNRAEQSLSVQEVEERKIKDHYFNLIELAKQQGKDTVALTDQQAVEINDVRKKHQDIRDKADADAREKDLEAVKAAEAAKAEVRAAALDDLESIGANMQKLFVKSKGLQKSGLLVESAVGVAKIIINTQEAALKSQATFPGPVGIAFSAVNYAAGALAVAAAIKATADGLKKIGEGGDAGSGASVGQAQGQAAQFNIVGASQNNQLAQSFGKQSGVIKAQVVSSEVSNAQALDRNRVEQSVFLSLLPFIGIFLSTFI